jgi:hypothetical protein
MITEDYCSYEVAKLLKNKGFDEECIGAYSETNHTITKFEPNVKNSEVGPLMYSAPTHQMAMKWLREVYGIFIAINNDDLDFNWQCYDLINRGSTLDPKILSESYAGYKTYEEAVEAALKYCLQNLIWL